MKESAVLMPIHFGHEFYIESVFVCKECCNCNVFSLFFFAMFWMYPDPAFFCGYFV